MHTVIEYVLYQGSGEGRQALFSDPDLDVVRAHRIDELKKALMMGYSRPEYSITSRTITHDLDKAGKPLIMSGKCVEADLDLTAAASVHPAVAAAVDAAVAAADAARASAAAAAGHAADAQAAAKLNA
jgi:hypothetical protein